MNLIEVLIVVSVPLLILAMVFVFLLGDRSQLAFPFLVTVGLLMLLAWAVAGLHPSGFFVSPEGLLYFAGVVLFAGTAIRVVAALWH